MVVTCQMGLEGYLTMDESLLGMGWNTAGQWTGVCLTMVEALPDS